MLGFLTDKGNVRELNEDFLSYSKENEFSIYVVGDGMGGHNAGEVASKRAVESIICFIRENYGNMSLDNLLEEAILYANSKIYSMSQESTGLSGMGTTITAILELKDIVYVANVGDSACFGINENGIKKITKDHSLVQELVDSGCITEGEAKNHPRKNIITRAIGTNSKVDVDIFKLSRNEYKAYLLCTDGLINDVEEEEIWKEVIKSEDFDKSCKELVEIAKERGGRDNITVLVFGGEK
ncbi:Stp1/IreP family PP2C-type Ser/Thr phosphatase [Clostridium sp.]|uniref:Stp1/IreP family PP2C-type Ser/Thr phosphatase n=1 Tax=Clostridium sp. TaxID=1506 RepID=UPI00261DAB89|nr:Stp1/IreP family PP2C-type Ser/Thr phosphatase [Clostridium sp.]